MLRCFLFLALPVAAAGCGVLTIDVDVYKGPLANTDVVRAQQLKVKLVGAQPLLVQLRDQLEANACYHEKGTGEYGLSKVKRLHRLYRKNGLEQGKADAFIPPECHDFMSENARRINNILSLYEDLDALDPKLSWLRAAMRDMGATLANYQRARAVLVQDDGAPTEKFRELILKHSKPPLRITAGDLDAIAAAAAERAPKDAAAVKETCEAWAQLRDSSWELMDQCLEFLGGGELGKLEQSTTNRELVAALVEAVAGTARVLIADGLVSGGLKDKNGGVESVVRELTGASRVDVVRRLRKLDSDLKQKSLKRTGATPADATRWGISRVEMGTAGTPPALPGQFPSVRRLAGRVTAGGFERGRLDEGLATLIDTYLRIVDEPGSTPGQRDRACTRLLHELSRFAEKILMLANHDGLLEELRPYRSAVRATGRFLKTRLWSGTPRRFDPKTYARILQAIGNSITVQVHDWEMKRNHGKRAKRRAKREFAALRSLRTTTVSEALDRIGSHLAEELKVAQGDVTRIEARLSKLNETLARPAGSDADGVAAATRLAAARRREHRACQQDLEKLAQFQAWQTAEDADKAKREAEFRDQKELDRLEAAIAQAQAALDLATAKELPTEAIEERRKTLQEEKKRIEDAATRRLGRWLVDGAYSQARIDRERGALNELLRSTAARAAEAATELALAKEAYAKRNAERVAAKEEHAALKRAEGPAKANLQALKKAQSAFQAGKRVLQASPPAEPIGGRAVKALLVQAIRASDDKSAAVIESRTFFALPDVIPGADTGSPQDAIDELVTGLTYMRLEAIATQGKDTPRIKKLEQAIAAAHEYRTGMIYLRSASTYLRTSYPMSSLQPENKRTDENMLTRHARKSLPLYNRLRRSRKDARLQSEIDRQFWQNINRVKVAGAGDTNSVVAKDDIGNWYVKRASSNPERIAESMKNMALFAAGNRLEADLLNPRTATGAASTVLRRQFDHFEARYLDRTDAEHQQTLESSIALHAALQAGFRELADAQADKLAAVLTANAFASHAAAKTSFDADVARLTGERAAEEDDDRKQAKTREILEKRRTRAAVVLDLLKAMERYGATTAVAVGRIDVAQLEVKPSTAEADRLEGEADTAEANAKEARAAADARSNTADAETLEATAKAQKKEAVEKRAAADAAKKKLAEATQAARAQATTLRANAVDRVKDVVRGAVQAGIERRRSNMERFRTAISVLAESREE